METEGRSLARQRLLVCLALHLAYVGTIVVALVVRLEAVRWGYLLTVGGRSGTKSVLLLHAVLAAALLVALMAVRRSRGVSPWVPKLMLAALPFVVLISADRLLTLVYAANAEDNAYIAHPVRGWTFRPGWTGSFLGAPMRINQQGLPGPDLPLQRDPNEYRILFLGDSVTAGFGVPEDTCFVRRLPRLANNDGAPAQVTAVNCAVTSYSPWQQIDLLESEGLRYGPDLIVYVVCMNDFVEKFQLQRFGGHSLGPQEPEQSAMKWSGIYRMLSTVSSLHQDAETVRQHQLRLDAYSVRRFIEEPDHPDFQPAWSITFENQAKIVGVARRNGIPMAMISFPYAPQLDRTPGLYEEPQRRLRDFAIGHNVPFLDLLPVYRAYINEHGVERNALFIDSFHPTPLGHQIAAEAILSFLRDRSLMPSGWKSPEK